MNILDLQILNRFEELYNLNYSTKNVYFEDELIESLKAPRFEHILDKVVHALGWICIEKTWKLKGKFDRETYDEVYIEIRDELYRRLILRIHTPHKNLVINMGAFVGMKLPLFIRKGLTRYALR